MLPRSTPTGSAWGEVEYLPRRAGLDVGGTDVPGSPVKAEVVGRVSVPLTGQVELQVLLAELGAQERPEHQHPG